MPHTQDDAYRAAGIDENGDMKTTTHTKKCGCVITQFHLPNLYAPTLEYCQKHLANELYIGTLENKIRILERESNEADQRTA